jgi:iron complex outermembrane receptor protein
METEGVDLAVSYRLPRTAYGQFGFRNETSYTDSFRTNDGPGTRWKEYVGEYYYNRVKSNTSIDWALGNWNATWGFRYYSPTKDTCWDVEELIECNMPNFVLADGNTGANKLGSVTIHDVSVGYKTSWDGRFLFGINNVFDKSPRMVYSTLASASKIDADQSLDRFFYVRYTQNF